MFKHIIFDLDRTLVWFRVDWTEVKKEVMKYAENKGIVLPENFSLWKLPFIFPDYEKHSAEINRIFERYEHKAIEEKRYVPYTDRIDLVKTLDDRVLSIASNNCHSSIELMLKELGIR